MTDEAITNAMRLALEFWESKNPTVNDTITIAFGIDGVKLILNKRSGTYQILDIEGKVYKEGVFPPDV